MNRGEKCHYDSSKNVHDISTVSVRYRYESIQRFMTTVAQRMLTVPCTVRYGTSTIRGGSSVAKP